MVVNPHMYIFTVLYSSRVDKQFLFDIRVTFRIETICEQPNNLRKHQSVHNIFNMNTCDPKRRRFKKRMRNINRLKASNRIK